MRVTAEKLTDVDLMRKACEMTMHGKASNVQLAPMYAAEHSPCRTQIFWLALYGVPSFVSVHLVRHKIGVEHFVTSNRDDRGGETEVNRLTPVNHGMLINAQALINMARKRLCGTAHMETQKVMWEIRRAISGVDPDLALYMRPDCLYRHCCYEFKPCGRQALYFTSKDYAGWEG